MRRFKSVIVCLVLVLAAQSLLAATYYVGTCASGAYSTIQAAVSGVPAGSTIKVCPGTYAEQVTISQALTIEGFSSGNSSQSVIAMPSTGLTTTSSISVGTVAPQLEVTAGPVNITNITVDGTATSSNCPSTEPYPWYTGVFYSSGSSGTMKGVETRYQNCNGLGMGILIENGSGPNQSVTTENSYVHDNTAGGILALTIQNPPTLAAPIKNCYVSSPQTAILVRGTTGSVSDNYLTGGFDGVFAGSAVTVTGNTVIGEAQGISLETADVVVSNNTVSSSTYFGIFSDGGSAGSSITSNQISNSGKDGIYLNTGGVTIKSNTIIDSPNGIEFSCNTGNTTSGNTIIETTNGFDQFPPGSTSGNNFYNVATISTGGWGSDAAMRNVRPRN
jgi:parallel beta-helix repeat protein